MSIMDFFTSPKPQPSADSTNQNAAQTVNSDPTQAATLKPVVDPNNPSKDTQNPLDAYEKLFDNATTNSDIQAPSFSLDPSVVKATAGKLDFTKGINPELIQKANSGDATAMMQLIQEVSRNSYQAALEHTTKLTDAHLGQRAEFDTQRVQKGVKQQLTSDALRSNPNYSHPVVRAELNRIAQAFAASPEYVDASPQQIAEAAKNYMLEINKAMSPTDPTKDSKGNKKAETVDYVEYLGFGSDS